MFDPAASLFRPGVQRTAQPSNELGSGSGLALSRVTKGVASAIGKSLAVERDAALPDHLASLVERLQAGPLGQPKLKSRRVA